MAISGQSFFTQDCRYIGLTPTEAKMIGHGLALPIFDIGHRNSIVTTPTQFKPQTLLPILTPFGFDTNIGQPTLISLYKIKRKIRGQSFLLPSE